MRRCVSYVCAVIDSVLMYVNIYVVYIYSLSMYVLFSHLPPSSLLTSVYLNAAYFIYRVYWMIRLGRSSEHQSEIE